MSKLRACNADLAEVVEHMTRLEPENRFSVDQYLHSWPKAVFPAFFGPLHDLLSPLMTWAQDHSVLLLKASFSGFLTRLQNKSELQKGEDGVAGAEVAKPACDRAENDEGGIHQQLPQLALRTSTRAADPQHAAQGATSAAGSGPAGSSSHPGGPAAQVIAMEAPAQSGIEQAGVDLVIHSC